MDTARNSKFQQELKKRLDKSGNYLFFVDNFSKCSNNESRIECVYRLPEFQNLFNLSENFENKNLNEAEEIRVRGNELFLKGEYDKAEKLYTKSIIKAPDDSSCLPLAYGNRSSANFSLKRYVLSLQDIGSAFSYNFPEKSSYKLFLRMGKCMYYLKQKEMAIKYFRNSIAALDKSDLSSDKKTKIETEIVKFISQCEGIESDYVDFSFDSFNKSYDFVPDLSNHPNSEVPSMSSSVEIKRDNYGGRSLFATKDINIGDIIITETPLSSCLLEDFDFSHCHNCCNRLKLPLPCKNCAGVVFCSPECREIAWNTYHSWECTILKNIQDHKGSDLGMLSTRMVLTAGVNKILEMPEEEENNSVVDCAAGFSEEGIYSSSDYKSAFSLVNHSEKRSSSDLLNRTISALYFLKNLELTRFFEVNVKYNEKSSIERMIFKVGAHILRNNMMLPCNAHQVSEFNVNQENPAMSTITELGAAIYPVLSLINHSCDPSVVRHSYGNICVARAIRSIPAGSEIFDNYGALYPTMNLKTRQSQLQSQYYFKCSCEACTFDWPQYFNIPCELPVIRCRECYGVTIVSSGDSKSSCTCQEPNSHYVVLQLGELEADFVRSLKLVIAGDCSEQNYQTLLRYLQFADQHVQRPWRNINDCQEALKQCINMTANCYGPNDRKI